MDYSALAKQYGGTTLDSNTVDYSALAEHYGGTTVTPTAIASTEPAPPPTRGILGGAINTLLVKPAARFAEAVGRTGILGNTIKQGYESMQGQNQEIRLPGAKNPIGVVEPQKALGEGGATQIFSDALKSATLLAPYGKIAGVGIKAAEALGAGVNVAKIAGGAFAGAGGGYGVDVASKLDENGVHPNAFVPGFNTLLGGLTGGALEVGGVGLEKLTQKASQLSKELQQQTFKLTPTEKIKLGQRLDSLTQFANENLPAGSPDVRYAHIEDLYHNYESNLQYFLDTVAQEKRASTSVPKATLFKQLSALKGLNRYERDYGAVNKQIDSVIELLNTQYKGDLIPVDKLNILKRSTYENAYNKAGDKVLDFIEHDMGDIFKRDIEKAVSGGSIGGQSIKEFNADYGKVIQLRKILRNATARKEIGFTKNIVSRLTGGLIGGLLGHIPGAIAGEVIAPTVAEKLSGTAAKTKAAAILKNVKPLKVGSVIQRIR